MSISMRDKLATVLVAIGTLIAVLWFAGFLDGLTPSSVALIILVLGVVASASAVVPGFAALLAGSRLYLALASLGGLVALVCGAITVVQATQETLAILVMTTIGLWAAATVRHGIGRGSNVATG